MTDQTFGSWRVWYEPGDWFLINGPRAIVVLPSSAAESGPVADLWGQVSEAPNLDAIVAQLGQFNVSDAPTLAAFFWVGDDLRGLIRGQIRVVDVDRNEIVADGNAVRTFSEVAFNDRRTLQVDLGEPSNSTGNDDLPVVAGVVRSGSFTIDARESSRLRINEPQQAKSAPAPAASELPSAPKSWGNMLQDPNPPQAPRVVAEAPPLRSVDNGSAPAEQSAPSHGVVLRPSSGDPVNLRGAVIMGRAPVATTELAPDVSQDQIDVLTLWSPANDISRNHAQISRRNGQLVATDLNSTNGTVLLRHGQVDQGLIREKLPPGQSVKVDPGDVLELGDGVSVAIEQG